MDITAPTIILTLIWGVAIGCIYILLATGLNIIFGVMKLVNFAHGQFLMIGAFLNLDHLGFRRLKRLLWQF